MKILINIKNIFIHIRSSLKFIFLIIVATLIIGLVISFFYKPIYSVTIDGEFIGYTENKTELQKKINNYIEYGEGENIAFVDIDSMPEYSLCLLKKDNKTNDDEIFKKVKDLGKNYYQYYAIVENDEEKYYVGTKEQAEEIIEKLKSKNSSNIDKIAYTQVYGTELKGFEATDTIVTALYKKKQKTYTSSGGSYTVAYSKVDLSSYGVSFINPVSGMITSRFGARSGGTHTGLDIAAPTGTTIVAADSGTVTFSGNTGSGYGNYIIISHGSGVQTLYGHCSRLYVSQGQTVSKGEAIATVGSTGNSTGSHLHLEVRVNGSTLNPEYYVY